MTATATWTNWAGNVQAEPRVVARPESREDLRAVVREAARRGETVRVAGAGHSFAPLCATDGTLLDLSLLAGLERVYPETGEATIWAGTRLYDLGEPLLAQGRALANQGDIDRQAVAGAVSTGTHGTGRKHGSFSAAVRAVELMQPDGELITIDGSDPERLRAASLSLGLLGVITQVTLATVPAYRLHERSRAMSFDEGIDGFLAEEEARRNADSVAAGAHVCVLKTLEETDEAPYRVDVPEGLPGALERYLKPDAVDWSCRIYPSTRAFRFVELEYTIPLANGPAALREARQVMQARHPDCTWVVEYRTQPGEPACSARRKARRARRSASTRRRTARTRRSSATWKPSSAPTAAARTGGSCTSWGQRRSPRSTHASTRSAPSGQPWTPAARSSTAIWRGWG